MAAKKLDLGVDLKFTSIAEAKSHYDKVLKDTPIDQRVTSAEFDEFAIEPAFQNRLLARRRT